MRQWKEEFGHDYRTYRFGYCDFGELEPGDSIEDIYAHGWLPYSADPNQQGVFYRARTVRIVLPEWELSSENRRIVKRFDGVFKKTTCSVTNMENDVAFKTMFLSYFKERHGETIMPLERLEGILHTPLPLFVTIYSEKNTPRAYVLSIEDGALSHFWYSAYDLARIEQSLGMWLMIDTAQNLKTAGKNYLYLGTVYGEKALYKTNFNSLEWWDGNQWHDDISKLKTLARND